MARLKEKYKSEVVPKLQEKFAYVNCHQIPRIEKVVLNMGVGDAVQNSKAVDAAAADMALIAGQKPAIRRAKKSIANYKVREGMPIGVAVTLRSEQMYEFLDRFMNVALPRVRDFRGVPKHSFDGRGNYSMGITEQLIFPEIDMDKSATRGLDVTVVTSAKTNEEAFALLQMMGMPFRN